MSQQFTKFLGSKCLCSVAEVQSGTCSFPLPVRTLILRGAIRSRMIAQADGARPETSVAQVQSYLPRKERRKHTPQQGHDGTAAPLVLLLAPVRIWSRETRSVQLIANRDRSDLHLLGASWIGFVGNGVTDNCGLTSPCHAFMNEDVVISQEATPFERTCVASRPAMRQR